MSFLLTTFTQTFVLESWNACLPSRYSAHDRIALFHFGCKKLLITAWCPDNLSRGTWILDTTRRWTRLWCGGWFFFGIGNGNFTAAKRLVASWRVRRIYLQDFERAGYALDMLDAGCSLVKRPWTIGPFLSRVQWPWGTGKLICRIPVFMNIHDGILWGSYSYQTTFNQFPCSFDWSQSVLLQKTRILQARKDIAESAAEMAARCWRVCKVLSICMYCIICKYNICKPKSFNIVQDGFCWIS